VFSVYQEFSEVWHKFKLTAAGATYSLTAQPARVAHSDSFVFRHLRVEPYNTPIISAKSVLYENLEVPVNPDSKVCSCIQRATAFLNRKNGSDCSVERSRVGYDSTLKFGAAGTKRCASFVPRALLHETWPIFSNGSKECRQGN
jgi:hypothetical protein